MDPKFECPCSAPVHSAKHGLSLTLFGNRVLLHFAAPVVKRAVPWAMRSPHNERITITAAKNHRRLGVEGKGKSNALFLSAEAFREVFVNVHFPVNNAAKFTIIIWLAIKRCTWNVNPFIKHLNRFPAMKTVEAIWGINAPKRDCGLHVYPFTRWKKCVIWDGVKVLFFSWEESFEDQSFYSLIFPGFQNIFFFSWGKWAILKGNPSAGIFYIFSCLEISEIFVVSESRK